MAWSESPEVAQAGAYLAVCVLALEIVQSHDDRYLELDACKDGIDAIGAVPFDRDNIRKPLFNRLYDSGGLHQEE